MFFKKRNFGEIATILSNNIEDADMFIITTIDILFARTLFLVLSFGYLIKLSPIFVVLVISEAAMSYFIIRIFTNPLERAYDKKLKGCNLYNSNLERTYNSYEDSRMNFISNISLFRLFKIFELFKNRNLFDRKMNSIYMFVQEFKGALFDVLALVFAIYLIKSNKISVGDYVAYTLLKPATCGVFNGYTHLILNFNLMKVAVKGINEIIPVKQYIEFSNKEIKGVIIELIKSLKIDGLSFKYDEESPEFKDLNYTFEKNRIYTVRGKNGVGKTTFLRLLTGLCRPQSGGVKVNNDKDIGDVSETSLGNKIKVLSQDPRLYDDTIENNINILGKAGMEDKIRELVDLFKIEEITANYKSGMESNIFENGVTLSGGQVKKICLARTLLYDSDVLIFDEPLGSLDKESRKNFCDYIDKISEGKIIIIISHHEECYWPEKEISLVMEIDEENNVNLSEVK